jgi:hypothetical protein
MMSYAHNFFLTTSYMHNFFLAMSYVHNFFVTHDHITVPNDQLCA